MCAGMSGASRRMAALKPATEEFSLGRFKDLLWSSVQIANISRLKVDESRAQKKADKAARQRATANMAQNASNGGGTAPESSRAPGHRAASAPRANENDFEKF